MCIYIYVCIYTYMRYLYLYVIPIVWGLKYMNNSDFGRLGSHRGTAAAQHLARPVFWPIGNVKVTGFSQEREQTRRY